MKEKRKKRKEKERTTERRTPIKRQTFSGVSTESAAAAPLTAHVAPLHIPIKALRRGRALAAPVARGHGQQQMV